MAQEKGTKENIPPASQKDTASQHRHGHTTNPLEGGTNTPTAVFATSAVVEAQNTDAGEGHSSSHSHFHAQLHAYPHCDSRSHSHSHPHVHWDMKSIAEEAGAECSAESLKCHPYAIGWGFDVAEHDHGHGHGVCAVAGAGIVVEIDSEEDLNDDHAAEEEGQEEDSMDGVTTEEGDTEHSISDPLSDPRELKALTSTLSSYYLYRRTAHLNLTHQRRKAYWGLSRQHREILEKAMGAGGGGYLGTLSSVDDAIAKNAEIAEGIFASGIGAFGVNAESPGEEEGHGKGEGGYGHAHHHTATTATTHTQEHYNKKPAPGKTKPKSKKPWWQTHATPEDLDKVKSTLKQFYRDWASEGHAERVKCYKPVLDELCSRFPLNVDIDPSTPWEGEEGERKGGRRRRRDEIRVLVPGAGLGRLAFDIVCAGFESQGNEFSYHQLVASNFVLNCTTKPNEFTLHPWIHSFSHHLSRKNHLRAVQIPDVHPGGLLIKPTSQLPQNPYSPSPLPQESTPSTHTPYSLPATRFSMIAGDFLQCYGTPGSTSSFDAVATVFFIDTAPNVVGYVQTIYKVLGRGGVWVNLGPLLWHWEGREVVRGAGGSEARGSGSKEGDGAQGIESTGSVELTLEEVLGVVEACGFRVVKRGVRESGKGKGRGGEEGEGEGEGVLGEVKTGYIQDERSMLNYEYKAQFWVAVKE